MFSHLWIQVKNGLEPGQQRVTLPSTDGLQFSTFGFRGSVSAFDIRVLLAHRLLGFLFSVFSLRIGPLALA